MPKNDKIYRTTIGGQAIIEGVMMRGPEKTCMAVRKSDGEIETKVTPTKGAKSKMSKIPFFRGCSNFILSLTIGLEAINFSAAYFEEDEEVEKSRFEKWMDKVFGDRANDIFMGISMVLGILLAIGLFIMLPTILTGLLPLNTDTDKVLRTVIEGSLKITIFVLYLFLVSRLPDIKRVFAYHGAEHKTISCYEHGEELVVENIKKYPRFHPRCGTSFLLIVMLVSIVIFSFLTWDNIWLRIGLRLLLLPVVVGISYEIIRFAGRHENPFTKIISAPGMWFQRLTTKEPDDSMIEVAIEALTPCLPEQKESDKW